MCLLNYFSGPVKGVSPKRSEANSLLRSGILKQSASQPTLKVSKSSPESIKGNQSNDYSNIENVTNQKEVESTLATDEPSSPSVSGAQLLAEENNNTVKRSPKNVTLSKSSTDSSVSSKPSEKSDFNDKPELSNNTNSSANKTNSSKMQSSEKNSESQAKSKTKKSDKEQTRGKSSLSSNTKLKKVQQEKNSTPKKKIAKPTKQSAYQSDSEYASSNMSDISKSSTDQAGIYSNEDQTLMETNAKTVSSDQLKDASSSPKTSKDNLETAHLEPTVKPKGTVKTMQKTDSLLVSGKESSGSSSSPLLIKRKTPTLGKTQHDSSGDSEDEDQNVLAQRVSLSRQQLLPNLLTKVNL